MIFLLRSRRLELAERLSHQEFIPLGLSSTTTLLSRNVFLICIAKAPYGTLCTVVAATVLVSTRTFLNIELVFLKGTSIVQSLNTLIVLSRRFYLLLSILKQLTELFIWQASIPKIILRGAHRG